MILACADGQAFALRVLRSPIAKTVLPIPGVGEIALLRDACENSYQMKLQINGADRDFDTPLSLASLLEQLGMKADRVAVELNRNIVPRQHWPETSLADGDQLEIVHFVGGGVTAQELL